MIVKNKDKRSVCYLDNDEYDIILYVHKSCLSKDTTSAHLLAEILDRYISSENIPFNKTVAENLLYQLRNLKNTRLSFDLMTVKEILEMENKNKYE